MNSPSARPGCEITQPRACLFYHPCIYPKGYSSCIIRGRSKKILPQEGVVSVLHKDRLVGPLGRPGLGGAHRPGPDVEGASASPLLRRPRRRRVQLVPPREPRGGAGGVALPHVHHRDPLCAGGGCGRGKCSDRAIGFLRVVWKKGAQKA